MRAQNHSSANLVGVNDSPRATAGAYELLLDLASGGMGTVYLGKSPTSPLVAIKRPHPHLVRDEVFMAMLHDEARLASAISHPNVVKVRELGFEGEIPFVVLDYIEGVSLAELRNALVKVGVAIAPRIALRIVFDALFGLEAAHTLTDETGKPLEIIHRDVSPHNVIVGTDGVSRLTDFGVAKANDRLQTTRVDEVKGKLAYLAPERVDDRRQCTVQSDVFSMAVVLWECLAGRRLFRGEEAAHTIQEVVSLPIPSLTSMRAPISEALDRVIARGLERDLSARFPSARAFREALMGTVSDEDIADPREVAELVERALGPKIDAIHLRLRALGDEEYARLITATRLRPRTPNIPPSADTLRDLSELGPTLSSQRYVIGAPLPSPVVSVRPSMSPSFNRAQTWLGGAGAAAVALLLVVGACAHKKGDEGAVDPRAIATPKTTISLPFYATTVTVDGATHDLSPAKNELVLEVPPQGSSARIEIALLDGTRARGTVNFHDGRGEVDPATLEIDSLGDPEGIDFSPAEAPAPVAPKVPLKKRPPRRWH